MNDQDDCITLYKQANHRHFLWLTCCKKLLLVAWLVEFIF